MTEPLVSVLTPSFRQARWLGDNLRSVACQTYLRIEHVVMDGGSTDGTAELLVQAGRGVIWRSEPDNGQSDALNKAFAASTGEIVGWLNSDDAYWDARVIEDVVAFFAAHADADVVYGHAASVNEDGLVLSFYRVPQHRTGRLLRQYDYLIQPAVFMRRRVLGKALVDETYHFAMDYELWLRLASARARFLRIDRILAVDRVQRMRKSLKLLDVLAADRARLAGRYGVATSPASRRLASVHAVWCRFAGVPLAWHLPPDFAFDARLDGRRRLIARQCLTRRRDMSAGEG